jgi:PAT family beta-lactamase induction signal transducer AmpG
VSLRQKLVLVAALYFVEGFPPGISLDVWPVWFRLHGASLVETGWLTTLGTAYTLKFLWSPLVDRYGDYRRWIVVPLLVMAASLAVVAASDPMQRNATLWVLLAAFCLASATQDIAIDAYTIGLLDRGEEGPANGVRVTAYRVGILVSGGALLFLPRWIGWPGTLGVAAGLLALLSAMALSIPTVRVPRAADDAMWPALRRWLSRPGAPQLFAFVLLYRLGDLSMGPMVKPFWIDRGMSLEEIGAISTSVGTFAVVSGALAGGLFIRSRGLAVGLLVLGILALLSNLGYAAVAAFPESGRPGLYAASVTESFCTGLATPAFLSLLMRACEKEHAAVQFACLSALSLLPRLVAGPLGGLAAQTFGYAPFFVGTALLAIPALALLPALRSFVDEHEV